MFWLPYFPPDLRFHFNAHNLLVYGREGDDYLISDPVGETPVRCARKDLEKARFAKGVLAPKGLLYYLTATPRRARTGRASGARALARTARIMLHTPLPIIGVRGIEMLARRVERLSLADGGERARLYVGNIVRMQEEIGTGGGGFRFLYASFLQELAASDRLRARWTGFAGAPGRDRRPLARVRARRGAHDPRSRPARAAARLAERLRALAGDERLFFRDLLHAARAWAR